MAKHGIREAHATLKLPAATLRAATLGALSHGTTPSIHLVPIRRLQPFLQTAIGACEEYSNFSDVQQPAFGQQEEPFVRSRRFDCEIR